MWKFSTSPKEAEGETHMPAQEEPKKHIQKDHPGKILGSPVKREPLPKVIVDFIFSEG